MYEEGEGCSGRSGGCCGAMEALGLAEALDTGV